MREVYGEQEIGRELRWCVTVIRHAAISAMRRQARWAQERLTINQVNDNGTEYLEDLRCPVAVDEFERIELALLLESLPPLQAAVLRRLLLLGESQQNVAKCLGISQQQVSRHKNRGLLTLREGTPKWNTPS